MKMGVKLKSNRRYLSLSSVQKSNAVKVTGSMVGSLALVEIVNARFRGVRGGPQVMGEWIRVKKYYTRSAGTLRMQLLPSREEGKLFVWGTLKCTYGISNNLPNK